MIVLIGKTNSGKSTILKRLVDLGFRNVVSFTTRPRRNGEIYGEDYYFIKKEMFTVMKDNNSFIETRVYNTKVDGVEEEWYYGLSWSEYNLTKDKGVVILDLEGTKELADKVGRENLTVVCLHCSNEEIRRRSKERGDCPIEAERRLLDDEIKLKGAGKFSDYVINANKNVDAVVADIFNMIK